MLNCLLGYDIMLMMLNCFIITSKRGVPQLLWLVLTAETTTKKSAIIVGSNEQTVIILLSLPGWATNGIDACQLLVPNPEWWSVWNWQWCLRVLCPWFQIHYINIWKHGYDAGICFGKNGRNEPGLELNTVPSYYIYVNGFACSYGKNVSSCQCGIAHK